mgnify:CR=1 FL=1
MGYACPVCEAPQADGEHLAHHLALTAMLHGDDHEAWLADRLPDWAERDPSGLAAAVVEGATEVDTESVSTEQVHDDLVLDRPTARREGATDMDPDTRRVIEEAKELTKQRRGDADGEE